MVKMTIRMGRRAGVFNLECGIPATVFGLEHRVCGPISGLITGLGEEMVVQLHESTCSMCSHFFGAFERLLEE